MSIDNEQTTLVCLFHNVDQARAALNDLHGAGIAQSAISIIGNSVSGSKAQDGSASSSEALASLGIPPRDLKHLEEGISSGGSVVAVSAVSEDVSLVERIFAEHHAGKIDEAMSDDASDSALLAGGAAAPGMSRATAQGGETAIPVVAEELKVGKRTVDQGGVRLYRRVVEIPVEESVTLRDEHVTIQRNRVDRPATQSDFDSQKNSSIELTETAEEAVVGKSARVVEEVLVGKQIGERVEHIQETVRRTEVEVEELPAADRRSTGGKRSL